MCHPCPEWKDTDFLPAVPGRFWCCSNHSDPSQSCLCTCRAKEKWIQATAAEVLRRLGRPELSEQPEESTMLDELVMVVASPRTKELLVDYAEHNKVQPTPHTSHIWM